MCLCFSYNPCLNFCHFQLSASKNEINLFNNHVLIVAPVTFAPAGATPLSAEFCFFFFYFFFSETTFFRQWTFLNSKMEESNEETQG